MRFIVLFALLGTLLAPTTASAQRLDDESREVLRTRARQEAAAASFFAAGAGGVALTAHILTPFRAKMAPQVGFVGMGLATTGLIQAAVAGGIHESIGATRTARGLRRNLRGASWVFGVAAGPVTVASIVGAILSGWTDPSISFAVAQTPLNFIAISVQLGIWADRMERVRVGEDPFLTKRGRPKPRLIPTGTGIALVW